MNQTAKNTLFFTSVLALVTAGSVFSAVRSNDRPSEISGPVLMEQSAGGPVDKAPGNTSGDASPASGEKHVSPETAPAKVKPSVPPVFEERKNRPADDEGRARLKNIDAAAVSDGERAGLLLEKSQESSLSAAPAASTDAATEQTGVEELVYEDPASRDRPSLILAVFRVPLWSPSIHPNRSFPCSGRGLRSPVRFRTEKIHGQTFIVHIQAAAGERAQPDVSRPSENDLCRRGHGKDTGAGRDGREYTDAY